MALHERVLVQRSFHREFAYRGVEDLHHQQVIDEMKLFVNVMICNF